jgi:hypothetical protein
MPDFLMTGAAAGALMNSISSLAACGSFAPI